MKFGRRLKKGVRVSTDTDCQNCDSLKQVCVWDGECDNLEPLTEQEYIQTCTTEQLAEWIAHQTMIALLENQNNHSLRMTYPAYWVEWLKQPHTSKE